MNILPPPPPPPSSPNNLSNINPSESEDIFVFGQFLYVIDVFDREMLQNAWTAINQLDLWEYMKRPTDSYMMSSDPEINIITKKMEDLGYNGHSGSSFGWTMRQMQHIAQHGEDDFMDTYLTNNR
jgi:hypothetical protein